MNTPLPPLFLRAVLRSAFALLLGTAGAVSALAEDAVLLSSTVPEHVPGMILAENQTLALPSGGAAVLLFRSGEMVQLKGPFDGTLAGGAARAGGGAEIKGVAGLVQFLRGQGVDASVMGATRAVASAPRRPASTAPAADGDDIAVNLERSGIYCLGPADTVWLHRPMAAAAPITGTTPALPPLRLQLRRGGGSGGGVREVSWPAGASRIEWPTGLMIEDGDRFEALDATTGAPVVSMIFRRLEPPPSRAAWVAQSLLLGCREQAEPALQELARSLQSTTDRQ